MATGAKYYYRVIKAENLGDPTKDEMVALPTDLPPEEILDYLTERFGEPREPAVTDTEDFGALAIGWVFERAGPNGSDQPAEVVIVPMIDVEGDTDGVVSMFVYQEKLRAGFTSMASQAGIEVQTVHLTPNRKNQ